MRKLFFLVGLVFALSVVAQYKAVQLDSLFSELYKKQQFFGNVLISDKGNIIYQKSFGKDNHSTNSDLNAESVFELASVSKQFTAIYKALTDPVNGWRLLAAARYAREHRDEIEALARDPEFAIVVQHLLEAETALQMRKRRFALARLRYRWHSLRRRRRRSRADKTSSPCRT